MPSKSTIHYHIHPADIHRHLFHIHLTIPQPSKAGQQLWLPAWIPGSYMIRDFSKHLINIRAEDEQGQPVTLTKLDKQRWQLASCEGPVHIFYQVYAFDFSVRGSYLASDFGFFNGTSVFLAVEEQTDQPVSVTMASPTQPGCQHWQLATSMPGAADWQFGDYRADDYWQLIDHPVLMGELDCLKFNVDDVQFDMVFVNGWSFDKARVSADMQRICKHHLSLFGGQPPFKRYTFLTMLTDNGFGGLEHCYSTALISNRHDLPQPGQAKSSEGYQTFLSLCSHELFHAWLVKRIRPSELLGADLQQETYTRQLWIYEGITSFYDDMALVRSGAIAQQNYLTLLGQLLTRITRNSGRFNQTVSDSSFDAWTKFYQQDENAINAIVSYYAKGALIALCLDLLLRQHSNDQYCLDDVLRLLWQRHGLTGIGTENSIIAELCAELGVNVDDFLHQALNTTDELPVDELLAKQGIGVHYQSRPALLDKGGQSSQTPLDFAFGAQYSTTPAGLIVNQVSQSSPASDAGLCKGDLIVAVDGWQIQGDNLATLLSRGNNQSPQTLQVFRRGKLHALTYHSAPAQADSVYLTVTDQQRAEQWMTMQHSPQTSGK